MVELKSLFKLTPALAIKYFKNKENFAKVCRCKDCLYFEYTVGSYGICEHWHTNSQDIFDLNYCGYAEPRASKERGVEK